MNNKIIGIIVGCLVLVCGWLMYKTLQTPKVAYVRSADLIYGYEGMKEAQKNYEAKSKQWQSNIDTLSYDFEKAVNNYNTEFSKLSEKERKEKEKFLSQQEQNLSLYSKNLKEQAKTEESKMTEGVLNQINSFVEEYAKKQGYDLILGTNVSGNILYGAKYIDITEEVLEEINKNYSTQPGAVNHE